MFDNQFLHVNIPFFAGYLDEGFLYDKEANASNARIPMEFFVYTSIPGRCGMFTGMTEWGTQHARIPIHYLHTTPTESMDVPLDYLQLWDSFGYYCSANQYDYLKNRACDVILKNKEVVTGTYMFTLDWGMGGYSEIASGHKTGHVIEAEGRILIQPNNRIVRWADGGAFTTGPLQGKPDWRVFSKEYSCEQTGGRWVSASEDELFWYDFTEVE